MKNKDYTVPAVLILGLILLGGMAFYFIHQLVAEIETIGLKAIWEQIWCGKDGCH